MHVSQENIATDVGTDFYETTSPYADSVDTHYELYYYIGVPVSLLGIVGNLVSLAVWNKGTTTYNASIFLFKYLAVWDTALLVFLIPLIFLYDIDPDSPMTITFDTSSYLARLVSVHTTLMIAVCRWLAVYRPLHVHNGSLLGRRQVIVGCLVIFVWCLAITIYFIYYQLWISTASRDSMYELVSITLLLILGLTVPIFLLVVFNVLLFCKLRSPRLPASSSLSRHQQKPGTWNSNRRLTLSVVLMSICLVLSYLVGEVFHANYWIMFQDLTNSELVNFQNTYSAFMLLQQINSGINIVFYLVFSSKFRAALTKHVSRCLSTFHS